ncbi:hypothetical protein BR93DRAFT_928774 [Coniochaeta sp. PMI_546]|nr:hypothetical protein BR93DRAFT_928774 [Coniochaeta sp. PMI_546]
MGTQSLGHLVVTTLLLATSPSLVRGSMVETPVKQAVLSWHSTSPHTPLMTCNSGFVPYCCGAFLDDPGDPGASICQDGPGEVASLEECETSEMIRRAIGGACVQKSDDGRLLVIYGAGMRCWVLIDDGMRSCREGESYGDTNSVVKISGP